MKQQVPLLIFEKVRTDNGSAVRIPDRGNCSLDGGEIQSLAQPPSESDKRSLSFAALAIAPVTQAASEWVDLHGRRRRSGKTNSQSVPRKRTHGYIRPRSKEDWLSIKNLMDRLRKRTSSLASAMGVLFFLALVVSPFLIFHLGRSPLEYMLLATTTLIIFIVAALHASSASRWRDAFEPANPRERSQEIQQLVVSSPTTAPQWEGLLRHAERSGVPILNGDIEQLCLAALLALKEEDLGSVTDQLSIWRSPPL